MHHYLYRRTAQLRRRHVSGIRATTMTLPPAARPTLVTFSTWELHALLGMEPISSRQLPASLCTTLFPMPRTLAPVARTAGSPPAYRAMSRTAPVLPMSVPLPLPRRVAITPVPPTHKCVHISRDCLSPLIHLFAHFLLPHFLLPLHVPSFHRRTA